MRVLVAGSREWPDTFEVDRRLDQALAQAGEFTLVHGAAARGVDAMADAWAARTGIPVERHPAQWGRHDNRCPPWHLPLATCKRAGMRRNAEMVALGADLCLVFIRDSSPGSTHTLRTATAAGIQTWLFVPGELPQRQEPGR
ncbi:DUF2493 domain-containing protein [Microbacterium enclense]|uniref:DUF2493 domain-containing protein n=1 Tax=Microbacterium enclense TaxID=993073 RepID=UPI003F7ED1D4